MLENIQRGDICVFNNGEEAAVIDFDKSSRYSVSIKFHKDVIGYSDRAKEQWCYEYDGRFLRDTNDPDGNDIVKVIKHV